MWYTYNGAYNTIKLKREVKNPIRSENRLEVLFLTVRC